MGSKQTCATETQPNIDGVGAVREGFLEEVAFALCPVSGLVNHPIFWICLIVSLWCDLTFPPDFPHKLEIRSKDWIGIMLNTLDGDTSKMIVLHITSVRRYNARMLNDVKYDHLVFPL